MDKKIIGHWGEQIAKNYLERHYYKILETNWHYKHKELDIIAYKDGLVAFEIKTRTSYTNLASTILKTKQLANLRLAVKAYCRLHRLNYEKSRLDLIVITITSSKTAKLKHHLDI